MTYGRLFSYALIAARELSEEGMPVSPAQADPYLASAGGMRGHRGGIRLGILFSRREAVRAGSASICKAGCWSRDSGVSSA